MQTLVQPIPAGCSAGEDCRSFRMSRSGFREPISPESCAIGHSSRAQPATVRYVRVSQPLCVRESTHPSSCGGLSDRSSTPPRQGESGQSAAGATHRIVAATGTCGGLRRSDIRAGSPECGAPQCVEKATETARPSLGPPEVRKKDLDFSRSIPGHSCL